MNSEFSHIEVWFTDQNSKIPSGCLCQYYRDKPALIDTGVHDNFPGNSVSSEFKQKTTDSTGYDGTKTVQIKIPLKYLSNFRRTLEVPLSSCRINLILTWSVNCVISNAVPNQAKIFAITYTKPYVPNVTLSIQDSAILLQQLKTRFKRIINWSKYQSKTEPLNDPNPYLYLLNDPIFQAMNRLFVLQFDANDSRIGLSRCCLPTVKVKHCNVMIN